MVHQLLSFCGIGYLIHKCSKNNYSINYKSPKRKFEIYPNNREDTSQIPDKQTTDE